MYVRFKFLHVCVCVCHGGEGRLSEKFENAMHRVIGDDVRYLHFDFHKICGMFTLSTFQSSTTKLLISLRKTGTFC
uniref:Uncharacterized protein n=1 Tax=Salix viminalis TaxID=40686 RepID=A0A6N2LY24_SALVM